MTTPTGPMDPERLADLRAWAVPGQCGEVGWEVVAELLADRDHWRAVAEDMDTMYDRAADTILAERRVLTLDDLDKVKPGLRGLLDDAESHRDRLHTALLTLARAVIDGDGLSAKTLAADVLDDHERGEL